ncbi:hypothetical protein M422DRAFT_241366 [Sphaerobolus stellatus SS14]|nr:hypothetical protein M422DRAFT_241366 [Sphaerobolus stellatus SS14]
MSVSKSHPRTPWLTPCKNVRYNLRLLSFPPEIVEAIVGEVDSPSDLFHLGLTCKALRSFIIPLHLDSRILSISNLASRFRIASLAYSVEELYPLMLMQEGERLRPTKTPNFAIILIKAIFQLSGLLEFRYNANDTTQTPDYHFYIKSKKRRKAENKPESVFMRLNLPLESPFLDKGDNIDELDLDTLVIDDETAERRRESIHQNVISRRHRRLYHIILVWLEELDPTLYPPRVHPISIRTDINLSTLPLLRRFIEGASHDKTFIFKDPSDEDPSTGYLRYLHRNQSGRHWLLWYYVVPPIIG